MKTIEIIGYKRANLGKSDAKRLREQGNVPCVVYGGRRTNSFPCTHDFVPAVDLHS